MPEIIKRILTSIFLLILLYILINNTVLLTIGLFFMLIELFNEFNSMMKKIFYKKNEKFKLFFFLTLINFYLIIFGLTIFIILESSNNLYKIYLLMIISICICTDIGGYCFGKLFKGKKLTKISPNKTYSGAIGSYISALLIPTVLFKNLISIEIIFFVVFIVSTISQIGDLFISYFKRKANLKDTGFILPGHGGLLDRFDGMIFAIPSGILLLYIL
ncbi:phosphatidate cytidylyltransferase [Candidatus Pelagibacter sp.]|nr:phosphatidate cytidylyltransferase [Candidatus Pelagibacter sp.]